MTSLLFGSIGTIADTSELQRQAFNDAFAAHGIDWQWDQEEYATLLAESGGADRVSAYAKQRGEEVDAAAVHHTKSVRFQELLGSADLTPRAGVVETIAAGKDGGLKLALVTTTATENVTALLSALEPTVQSSDFDLILDTTDVETPKPDPAAYALALERLGEAPGDCVAIEDNVGGVSAAAAARLAVVAFPGVNNAGHDFGAATRRVDHLDIAELRALAGAGA